MSADGQSAMDELKAMALRVATLVDALETRSALAMDGLSGNRSALSQAVEQLDVRGAQLMQDLARRVEASTKDSTRQALTGFIEERERWARQQRLAFRVGAIALGVGTLMLVAASSAWVAMKHDELAQVHFAEQIHRATEVGALVPCGEALCVRIGDSPRRAGERGEYLVVE